MNLKLLRKHYAALSLRERFSLFDQAEKRGDEAEMRAIVAASPRRLYNAVDIARLSERVQDLHWLNLLERLHHAAMFMQFFDLIGTQEAETWEMVTDVVLAAGYLYTIETDAWAMVGDEFGFSVAGFRQSMVERNEAVSVMEQNDKLMRKAAFTEEGMRQTLKRNGHNGAQVKTLAGIATTYREFLSEAEKKAA